MVPNGSALLKMVLNASEVLVLVAGVKISASVIGSGSISVSFNVKQ